MYVPNYREVFASHPAARLSLRPKALPSTNMVSISLASSWKVLSAVLLVAQLGLANPVNLEERQAYALVGTRDPRSIHR
jgi:hypothetical protein